MGKPLNWRWKLTLGTLGLMLFLAGYLFTESCHNLVLSKMNDAFNATPEDDRRASALAGRWLNWAYWRGNICGDTKAGYEMYRDFCGLPKNQKMFDVVFSNDPKGKLGVGKVSPDWQKGWGLLHPDAPDAFYDYISLMEPNEAGATTGREAKVYYMLFYTMHMKRSPDHKPHPKFNKYWVKIRQKILNGRVGTDGIPDYDPFAKLAPKWEEEK